jgi:hypothetical protein
MMPAFLWQVFNETVKENILTWIASLMAIHAGSTMIG